MASLISDASLPRSSRRPGGRALDRRRTGKYTPGMGRFRIAGQRFDLAPADIERAAQDMLPDPLVSHYTVIRGRRFPPKQLIAGATGLDRSDFTTHQARSILRRLGFACARRAATPPAGTDAGRRASTQADALAPYVGKWV